MTLKVTKTHTSNVQIKRKKSMYISFHFNVINSKCALLLHKMWQAFRWLAFSGVIWQHTTLVQVISVAWWHQAITWTNVELSSVKSCGVHLRTIMITSSNGNFFCITGLLCGEFTGHWWIPLTKVSCAEFWCFFYLRLKKRLSKQQKRRWFEMPSGPLWCHWNVIRNVQSVTH